MFLLDLIIMVYENNKFIVIFNYSIILITLVVPKTH